MNTIPPSAFRRDIQGLRAVAVVIVVLFHLGWEDLSGGYVGVDVFFVISGFLITGLIVRERAGNGTFPFLRFTYRRLRRLLPALVVTILATLVLAGTVLPPEYAKATARSAIAAMTYTENIAAWQEAGYFDAGAATKPLLHTWSLGVEEQFYLVWPLLIMLGYRFGGVRGATVAAGGAGIVSFAATIVFAGTPASFFLFPFRVFEFAIGALVWLGAARVRIPARLAASLVFFGLLAIFYAALEFDEGMTFPGPNALLPCLGTAFVLLSGNRTRAFGWLLENRAAQALGAISYALYLVHWPVLLTYVAWRYPGADYVAIGGWDAVVTLTICLALGAALHALIEKPVRYGALLATPRAVVTAAALGVGLVGVSSTTLSVVRPPQPFEVQGDASGDRDAGLRRVLRQYAAKQEQRFVWTTIRSLDEPFGAGRPRILVIGDSQADDLLRIMIRMPQFGETALTALESRKHCQINFNEEFRRSGLAAAEGIAQGGFAFCDAVRARIIADSRVPAADVVVLAYAWYPGVSDYLEGELSAYRALGARRMIVIGRKDLAASSLDLLARAEGDMSLAETDAAEPPPNVRHVNENIRDVIGRDTFIDVAAHLTDADHRPLFAASGYPIYHDKRHVTKEGANTLAALPGTKGMGARIIGTANSD